MWDTHPLVAASPAPPGAATLHFHDLRVSPEGLRSDRRKGPASRETRDTYPPYLPSVSISFLSQPRPLAKPSWLHSSDFFLCGATRARQAYFCQALIKTGNRTIDQSMSILQIVLMAVSFSFMGLVRPTSIKIYLPEGNQRPTILTPPGQKPGKHPLDPWSQFGAVVEVAGLTDGLRLGGIGMNDRS